MHTLAIKLGLVLLLGAATTVATSWFLVLRPAERWFDAKSSGLGCPTLIASLEDDQIVRVTFSEGVGWLTVYNRLGCDRGSYEGYLVRNVYERNQSRRYASRKRDAWLQINDRLAPPLQQERDQLRQHAFGWPHLALSFEIAILRRGPDTAGSWDDPTILYGLPLSEPSLKTGREAALPLKPRWSGFTINTSIYATVWAMMFLGGGFVVRRFRRPAGACCRCGYLLHGLSEPGCPECGLGRAEPPSPAESPTESPTPAG